uniref:Uncharacterized protein n=1 Tax=Glycine max TaxID=3847 RepID=C6T1R5_SOYBN|nr:unknown [Glycine max]
MRYTWFVRERLCKQLVTSVGIHISLKRIHISRTLMMFSLVSLSRLTLSRVDKKKKALIFVVLLNKITRGRGTVLLLYVKKTRKASHKGAVYRKNKYVV